MTDENILNNKEERNKLVQHYEVLDKVKKLLLITGTDYMTIKQIANYYEVGIEAIQSLYKENKEELDSDGVLLKSYRDFLNVLEGQLKIETQKGKVSLIYSNGEILEVPNRGIKVFSRRAILRVGMLLRDSKIAKEIRNQLLNIEEKTSNKVKTADIEEEQQLLLNVASAFQSGDIDKLLVASFELNKFKDRYIQELEPKALIVDNMIKNDSAVTTTITEKIKNTDVAKKWNRKMKSREIKGTTINVLEYIHDFINNNGYCPSVREICSGVGVSSTSTVHSHMTKLNSLGYLIKNDKETRNMRINEEKYVSIMAEI